MPSSPSGSLLGRPVTISGLGTYLPTRVVTNLELSQTLDTSDEWIRQRTGIRERRIADPGMSSSDLGILAGRAALEDAGVLPEEVGLVVTATISPDQLMPATAARIAFQCGCVRAGAYDVSAGCSGFVFALAMAASAVAAGLHDHVLVVGAETISRILDWEDRSTAVLFGDGAGAAVVSALKTAAGEAASGTAATDEATRGGSTVTGVAAKSAGGILGFDLGGDGSGADFLQIPAGGSRLPASCATVQARQHYMRMNGHEVYKFATRVVAESAGRVLERCKREVGDIDLFVPHQANLRIIEGAAKKLGIPEDRIFTNVERYGNTSCASIPLCLAEARAEGRLRPGDLVLLMGFGAGLSWGACLMEWGETGV